MQTEAGSSLFCAIAAREYFCWRVDVVFCFFKSNLYLLFSAEKSLNEIQLLFGFFVCFFNICSISWLIPACSSSEVV